MNVIKPQSQNNLASFFHFWRKFGDSFLTFSFQWFGFYKPGQGKEVYSIWESSLYKEVCFFVYNEFLIVFMNCLTAKLLKSQDGNLFFARVKTGRSGT